MMPARTEPVTDEMLEDIVRTGRYNRKPQGRMPLGLRVMWLLTIAALALIAIILTSGHAKAAAYEFQAESQTAAKITVNQGQTKDFQFRIKNTGSATWCKSCANPTRLGTANPHDRQSGFAAGSTGWLSPTRVEMVESSVAPGQIATFNFQLTGNPYPGGLYREYFTPLAEGLQWMSPDPHLSVDIVVPAKVGMFMFSWYEKESGHHWTNAPSNTTHDIPTLCGENGRYTSGNTDTIRCQLSLIRDMGVDYVILHWDGHGTLTDDADIKIIGLIRTEFPQLKYTFLVGDNSLLTPGVFNYLATFTPDPQYQWLRGKPMLGTFTSGPANQDSRFTSASFGAQYDGSSFHFWRAPARYQNLAVTVIGRYDDRTTCAQPFGRTACQVHGEYTTTLFDEEFGVALANRDNMDALFLSSWNEDQERISIFEPHIDATNTGFAWDFEYQKAKTALTQWKQ